MRVQCEVRGKRAESTFLNYFGAVSPDFTIDTELGAETSKCVVGICISSTDAAVYILSTKTLLRRLLVLLEILMGFDFL